MADTAVLEKILHVKEKEKDAAQLDKTEAVNRFEEIASRLYEELKRKENAESELDVVMKAKATITMIKEQSRYISLMKEKINTLQNNVQKARLEHGKCKQTTKNRKGGRIRHIHICKYVSNSRCRTYIYS